MTEQAVLVTGVSGYIASHVVKVLLENGYRVKGTVRSLENASKVDPLKNLVPEAAHSLELVEADLLKDDGWEKAMEGCVAVIHVASPFPIVLRAVQEEELIAPAREGTLRVLKAAVKAKVKKVVLTSSIVSVINVAESTLEDVYSEENWSNPDSPTIEPYSKSKVLAEKAAWDFLKELPDEEKFDFVVINPAFVMGPILMEAHKHSSSVQFLADIMNKTYPAHPRLNTNFCDVRDVAMAHLKALTVPEAVGHRHIIATEPSSLSMKDVSLLIAKEFRPQGYSIPTAQLPDFAIWIGGFFNWGLKNYVNPRLGKVVKFDNKRMVEVLGVQPTNIETSFIDMAYSLVDFGIVKKTKKYKQVGSRADVQAVKEEQTNDVSQGIQQEPEPEDSDEKTRSKDVGEDNTEKKD